MPIEINPQRIEGHWQQGAALDLHTISSTPAGYNAFGHMTFDNRYSPIGELLHRLKYSRDQGAAAGIIEAAATFLMGRRHKFEVIVPVPPSTPRDVQPVMVLADGIGAIVGAPVAKCISTTRPTTALKSVSDPEERRKLLAGLYAVDPAQTTGKAVLLFDDLFRSGSTMNEITDVLILQGKASVVRALTITKTRSNR